jgi:hypothetical protein
MRSRSGRISPKTPTRNAVSGRSGLPSAAIVNGMSEMCVTRCSATTGQKRLCDHFGIRIAVAPTPSTEKNDQLCALTWNSGR